MAFHVGQRVVCTDNRPRAGGRSARMHGETIPKEGGVYTIRSVFPRGSLVSEDCVRLVEIRNSRRRCISAAGRRVRVELCFRADRFRPLRTTSIEILKKMLEPVPQEPAELVDA